METLKLLDKRHVCELSIKSNSNHPIRLRICTPGNRVIYGKPWQSNPQKALDWFDAYLNWLILTKYVNLFSFITTRILIKSASRFCQLETSSVSLSIFIAENFVVFFPTFFEYFIKLSKFLPKTNLILIDMATCSSSYHPEIKTFHKNCERKTWQKVRFNDDVVSCLVIDKDFWNLKNLTTHLLRYDKSQTKALENVKQTYRNQLSKQRMLKA